MSSNPESAAPNQESAAVEKSITLKSSDGELFTLPISEAESSLTIKNLIEDCPSEVIPLANLEGKTLAKVIAFMKKRAVKDLSENDKNRFDHDFFSGMEVTDMFEVILAANYLAMVDLVDAAAQKIADTIKHKGVKWVRRNFNVVNDFEPEEEEQIRKEYQWAWEGDELEPDD